MRHAAEEAPSPTGETGPGYWQRFGEGFTFLRSEPLLLTVIVMVGITSCWTQRSQRYPYPSGARESGNGPSAIGLTGSMMRAAAVGGSLIAAVVAHRLRRRVVVLTGILLAGAPRLRSVTRWPGPESLSGCPDASTSRTARPRMVGVGWQTA